MSQEQSGQTLCNWPSRQGGPEEVGRWVGWGSQDGFLGRLGPPGQSVFSQARRKGVIIFLKQDPGGRGGGQVWRPPADL